MCGILGLVHAQPRPLDAPRLIGMCDSIRHRGPDDEGYLVANSASGAVQVFAGRDTPEPAFGRALPYAPERVLSQEAVGDQSFDVALGHRRLSIIDVSPAGHQPLCNGDGTLWILYNGEVYNFAAIREELATLGHTFFSNTDTEVVLHAYEEWGEACLSRFNGMFAFAILDLRRKRLFCARDRLGIKPFYFAHGSFGLVFGSEIKVILESGCVRAEPNEVQVHTYLCSGSDDIRQTFFEGILPLLPGHRLTLDLESNALNVAPYYELPIGGPRTRGSAEDHARGFYDHLERSVRYRLIADVPVGTCLSGGLDSSSIACLVDKLMRDDGLKLVDSELQSTFSARYEDPAHDEGEFIEEVVRATRSQAHDTYPTGVRLRDELDDFIWHHEEPFEGTSIYAQWCVFDLVKQSRDPAVKVTLDGQGGDEILGGYHRYYSTRNAQLLAHGKLGALRRELRGIERLHGYAPGASLREAIRVLTPMRLKNAIRPFFGPQDRPDWMDPGWDRRVSEHPRFTPRGMDFYGWDTGNVFERDLHRSLTRGIPRLLRHADRNSMAHSIESRVPFLDHELVEYTLALPDESKIREGMTKAVLRDAMAGTLPEAVRLRQSKVGFSTPQDEWFRNDIRSFVETTIHSEQFAARPYFDVDRVRARLASQLGGARVDADVWKWVNLETWLRKFVD